MDATGKPHPIEIGGDRDGQAGFTLIDMLVALALFALITALLTGTIATARRALAFVERANAVTPVAAAQNYIRSALTQARPKPRLGSADDSQLSFVGNAAGMSFITSYVPRGQFDGLYRVRIGLQASQTNPSLYDVVVIQSVDRPIFNPQAPPSVPVFRSILIGNVAAAAFSYYGLVEDQKQPQWQSRWSQLYKLPTLVAIDIQFASGDERIWPRLIVPLYASDSSSVPCPPRTACL